MAAAEDKKEDQTAQPIDEHTCEWAEKVRAIVNEWYRQRAAEAVPSARVHSSEWKGVPWRSVKQLAQIERQIGKMAGRLEDVLMGVGCDFTQPKKLPRKFV